MRKIDRAYGEHFDGQSLDITGAELLGCTFINCEIRMDSYDRSLLSDCYFNGCRLAGDGWRQWLGEAAFGPPECGSWPAG